MARDGIGRSLAESMVRSQISIEEKRGYADYVIDNSGTPEATRRQVGALWKELQKIPRRQAAGRKGKN
jgi:dephospho-CoA kinase